jgi:actin-related protein 6
MNLVLIIDVLVSDHQTIKKKKSLFIYTAGHLTLIHFISAASLIPYGHLFSQPNLPAAECTIVVDAGFSFTHVVPMIDGKIVWNAVKR